MAIRRLELATTPLFEHLKAKYHGKDVGMVSWLVRHYNNTTTVEWELVGRRNTRAGLFSDNRGAIERANSVITNLAAEYPSYLFKKYLCTLDACIKSDQRAQENEGTAYSEYEVSLGGEVVFKDTGDVKPKQAVQTPAPAPTTAPTVPVPKATPFPLQKKIATPYSDSVPGITQEFKHNAILPVFLEYFHKMHPNLAWTGKLWPAEATKVMVTAPVTPEDIVALKRGKVVLKWKSSPYKGKSMGVKWYTAVHKFKGIPDDDGVHLIRVTLGVSRDSIALRLIRFKL